MFFLPSLRRQPEFWQGVRDAMPASLGIGAWGLTTGVAMVKSGMSVFESIAMTLIVYAGSSQLAAIPLLVAGAPFWIVLAAGFCVNLRFVVFSLHLRPYLMHLPRLRRLVTGFLTADMSYALFVARFPEPGTTAEARLAQEAYLAGNCGMCWTSWTSLSLAGVGLANLIPPQWGLGFAGVLSLVAVVCSMASTRLRVLGLLVAAGVAVATYALPLKLNLVAAIAAAVLLCYQLERRLGLDVAGQDDR